MKILIDERNHAIIATGTLWGRKIKGVAVANEQDEFDAEFGTNLAVARFKANKHWKKYLEYDRQIRQHKRFIEDHKTEIAALERYMTDNYWKSVEFDATAERMLSERFGNR
jgi:hypothetical protein